MSMFACGVPPQTSRGVQRLVGLARRWSAAQGHGNELLRGLRLPAVEGLPAADRPLHLREGVKPFTPFVDDLLDRVSPVRVGLAAIRSLSRPRQALCIKLLNRCNTWEGDTIQGPNRDFSTAVVLVPVYGELEHGKPVHQVQHPAARGGAVGPRVLGRAARPPAAAARVPGEPPPQRIVPHAHPGEADLVGRVVAHPEDPLQLRRYVFGGLRVPVPEIEQLHHGAGKVHLLLGHA
mmetsp:Transcript_22453/g.69984  ORF Transcript_22453/g.69984 Transcript_22453/m.69984 type:complete len:235 (+) Transcript_22453:182-886(+)